MADETLLEKAIQNYHVARMIFAAMGNDDVYLNYVGYHLQQAVELSLKYQLEMSGILYPKTHDVDQLIRIGNENRADLITSEYIDDHAEMFSQWEAKTRYILNYRLEYKKVERATKEVGEYLQEVSLAYAGIMEQ